MRNFPFLKQKVGRAKKQGGSKEVATPKQGSSKDLTATTTKPAVVKKFSFSRPKEGSNSDVVRLVCVECRSLPASVCVAIGWILGGINFAFASVGFSLN